DARGRLGDLLSESRERRALKSLDLPARSRKCLWLCSHTCDGCLGTRISPGLQTGGAFEVYRSVLFKCRLERSRKTVDATIRAFRRRLIVFLFAKGVGDASAKTA